MTNTEETGGFGNRGPDRGPLAGGGVPIPSYEVHWASQRIGPGDI